jgi:hypothetical protein
MIQRDTTVSEQIAFLEQSVAKMEADLADVGSERRRNALQFLIEDARNRIERLKRRRMRH